jgi:hypothetical protein
MSSIGKERAALGEALSNVDAALRNIMQASADMLDRSDIMEDVRYLLGLLAEAAPDDTQIPSWAYGLVRNSVRAYHHRDAEQQRRDRFIPLVDARPAPDDETNTDG